MKKQGFLKKGIAFFAALTMALSMMFTAPVHATADNGLTIQKVWHDGDGAARPASVEVVVETEEIATGIKSTHDLTLSAAENWVTTIPVLPEYKYTVAEKPIPNYKTEVIKNGENNYTIVNTVLMGFGIQKSWSGDEEHPEARPNQIEVIIRRNGEEFHRAILKAPDWEFGTHLPGFDENGNSYTYTVEEVAVPNYTSALYGEGLPLGDGTIGVSYNILNTYTPENPNKPEEPKKEEPKTDKKPTTKTMPKTAAGVSLAAIIGL
ncbi:MAG: Cna B-type domain-containing protein, partial [Eubacteriales bacterium]|nr:Cna B-type domain-containing protein [Eubacteriales bacterium]